MFQVRWCGTRCLSTPSVTGSRSQRSTCSAVSCVVPVASVCSVARLCSTTTSWRDTRPDHSLQSSSCSMIRVRTFHDINLAFHIWWLYFGSNSCCSPLVVPVIRGEIGHGYCHLFFVFSILLTFLSLCSLSLVSNSIYLSVSGSLLMQSCNRILSLPRILFSSTASALCQISNLPFFPYVQPISAYSSPVPC